MVMLPASCPEISPSQERKASLVQVVSLSEPGQLVSPVLQKFQAQTTRGPLGEGKNPACGPAWSPRRQG